MIKLWFCSRVCPHACIYSCEFMPSWASQRLFNSLAILDVIYGPLILIFSFFFHPDSVLIFQLFYFIFSWYCFLYPFSKFGRTWILLYIVVSLYLLYSFRENICSLLLTIMAWIVSPHKIYVPVLTLSTLWMWLYLEIEVLQM